MQRLNPENVGTLEDSADHEPNGFDGNGRVSFVELLTVLGRDKWLIAKSTAVIVLIAIIVTVLLPKRYTATVLLLPPQQSSSSAAMLLSQLGNLGMGAGLAAGGLGGMKNPVDMYVSLLRSRSVEDAMVKRFDLMKLYDEPVFSDARKKLEKRCTIEPGLKDGLIRLSIEDSSPDRAAEMANAYIDEYKKLSDTLATTEAGQRRVFLEHQLADTKEKLASAEDALKQSQQSSGMLQLDSQARALIQAVAELRGQIAAKEVQIRSLSQFETADNPNMQLARQQLSALKAQLARLGGNGSNDNDLIVPAGKIPATGLEYIRKLREVRYQETVFEALAKQYELAKLDEARQGAAMQVVDPAVVPDRRSFPKRTLIVALAALLGVVFSAGFCIVRELVRRLEREPSGKEQFAALRSAWRESLREGPEA